MGSISLHGPQVTEVKNTTAARCDCRSPCNEEVLVQMWIGSGGAARCGRAEEGCCGRCKCGFEEGGRDLLERSRIGYQERRRRCAWGWTTEHCVYS